MMLPVDSGWDCEMHQEGRWALVVWLSVVIALAWVCVTYRVPEVVFCTPDEGQPRCGFTAWLHAWQEGWGAFLGAFAAAGAAAYTIQRTNESTRRSAQLELLGTRYNARLDELEFTRRNLLEIRRQIGLRSERVRNIERNIEAVLNVIENTTGMKQFLSWHWYQKGDGYGGFGGYDLDAVSMHDHKIVFSEALWLDIKERILELKVPVSEDLWPMGVDPDEDTFGQSGLSDNALQALHQCKLVWRRASELPRRLDDAVHDGMLHRSPAEIIEWLLPIRNGRVWWNTFFDAVDVSLAELDRDAAPIYEWFREHEAEIGLDLRRRQPT